MRGVQHRVGDARLDFVAIDALRMHGIAAVVRPGAADGRDGALLEYGQVGAHLPNRGRLRASPGRNSGARWQGSHGAARGVQLGRESGLAKATRRVFEIRIRTETGRATRGREGRAGRDSRRTEKTRRAEEAPRSSAGASGIRQKI